MGHNANQNTMSTNFSVHRSLFIYQDALTHALTLAKIYSVSLKTRDEMWFVSAWVNIMLQVGSPLQQYKKSLNPVINESLVVFIPVAMFSLFTESPLHVMIFFFF